MNNPGSECTSRQVAQLVLRDNRIKLSGFGDMNDPFELVGVSVRPRYRAAGM